MESKNDYYLIDCSKHYIKEFDLTYLLCVYSNGFMERTMEFKYGSEIPTILPYTFELSYVGLD